MWPMYVDYSEEECKRVLRSLELEAYANVVNALRAQGSLSKERRKYLQDSCAILGISMERHRAEIRRAVNDEHLNTIAERLAGPNTSTDWAIEGRRVVPLMPRLAPQTVFTAVADSVASAQAVKNASLPLPGKTGVREIGNGFETMASRKRKEHPPDSSASPCKIPALDSDYFNIIPFESGQCSLPEPSQPPSGSTSSESFSPPDSTSHVSSSFSEQAPSKTTASLLTSSAPPSSSPVKPPPKQIMLKSSSTVTTFSSYDQLNTNLLSSRPPSHSPSPAPSHEEQSAILPEVPKVPTEPKNSQRLSPSVCSLKTNTILPTTSTSSSLSSSDRLSMSSSTSSLGNKFLTQMRCKNSHSRQSLPSSLGFKLNSSQMSQKGLSPKSTPSLKMKQDNASNFFSKKLSQTVFSTSVADTSSQFSTSNTSESVSVPKSPVTVPKSSVKSEPSVVTTSPASSKLTTVTKTFPKTTTPSSQYMARSLFSSTKAGAKSLPPVIFNVSSSSVTNIQSSSKTTVSMQNDSTKASPQLLPKSSSVGITPSHLKIKAPNSIQYRNDGGVMRSARIVNISQPVGSRLPCAITPSAISALGLTPNIASTALRVTLPAGTLNTSAAMRVSGAAKPNVIVVHKAQMWPRTQQGAAVIMSSAASLPKISNDVTITEAVSLGQKQEKGKFSGTKLAPRPIAPAQSSMLAAVTHKIPETSLLPNPLASNPKPPASDSSENSGAKPSDNSAESTVCKRNLLADVIEASGILESAMEKAQTSAKDKAKNPKESIQKCQTSPVLESEAKSLKKNNVTTVPAEVISASKETTIIKPETTKISIDISAHSENDKGDINSKVTDYSAEQNKVSETLVSSSQTSENVPSTNESNASLQITTTKEKNL